MATPYVNDGPPTRNLDHLCPDCDGVGCHHCDYAGGELGTLGDPEGPALTDVDDGDAAMALRHAARTATADLEDGQSFDVRLDEPISTVLFVHWAGERKRHEPAAEVHLHDWIAVMPQPAYIHHPLRDALEEIGFKVQEVH